MNEPAEGQMGRRRRSRIEAEKIVAEFEASGLTRQAFCSQRDLSVTALDKYRRRRHAGLLSSAVPMIPVQLCSRSPEGSSLGAETGGALLVECMRTAKHTVDSVSPPVKGGWDCVLLPMRWV